MAEKVLLKKYANRRLYDTEQSKYVTLTEVTQLIRDGRQVEVIDAKTKEDVTAFILTQILLEQAKNKNGLLPVPLLLLIIQFGDNVLMDFFQKHLQQTITSYLAHKSLADEQFKKWLEVGKNLSVMAQENLSKVGPFGNIFDQFLKKTKTGDDNKGSN
jgi:polyhydroxyalkanoate synthesis repressor PhaR